MESIKPEKALEILTRAGYNTTLQQAAVILEFLNKLAEISLAVYITDSADKAGPTNLDI